MPELPEVETIKKELEGTILGNKITDVIVNNPRVIKEPKEKDFVKGLKNTVIKKILRRGKLLILELSSGRSLGVHLKMTGQLIYPGSGKGSRVSIKFANGKILDFMDRRLFGEMRLVDDWHNLKFIQNLGPESLGLKEAEFKRMLCERKTKIKSLLMDQTFISGIGNLYAAEALFRAKIHPERRAASLTGKEKSLLFKEIKATLREAIKYKGSSIDQYLRVSGDPGGYVKFHKVYGRQGKPCLVCKTPIQRISQGGRGTYLCPKCQR